MVAWRVIVMIFWHRRRLDGSGLLTNFLRVSTLSLLQFAKGLSRDSISMLLFAWICIWRNLMPVWCSSVIRWTWITQICAALNVRALWPLRLGVTFCCRARCSCIMTSAVSSSTWGMCWTTGTNWVHVERTREMSRSRTMMSAVTRMVAAVLFALMRSRGSTLMIMPLMMMRIMRCWASTKASSKRISFDCPRSCRSGVERAHRVVKVISSIALYWAYSILMTWTWRMVSHRISCSSSSSTANTLRFLWQTMTLRRTRMLRPSSTWRSPSCSSSTTMNSLRLVKRILSGLLLRTVVLPIILVVLMVRCSRPGWRNGIICVLISIACVVCVITAIIAVYSLVCCLATGKMLVDKRIEVRFCSELLLIRSTIVRVLLPWVRLVLMRLLRVVRVGIWLDGARVGVGVGWICY